MSYFWPTIQEIRAYLKLSPDLEVQVLGASEVDKLIVHLRQWYPDIIIGSESGHLESEFYRQNCVLGPFIDQSKTILPLVLRRDGQIIGMISMQKDVRARTLSARMGAVAPHERGAGFANLGPSLLEGCARMMKLELVYYFVTLKIPQQQMCAEKCGFQLVGIVPAYDIDMVRPGEPRRVFEALYAKVLVPANQIEFPNMKNLTKKTRALFETIFNEDPTLSSRSEHSSQTELLRANGESRFKPM